MRNRIVLFVPSFETGGVERNATFFANEMIKKGFAVELIYCRKMDRWFSKLDPMVKKTKIGPLRNLPFIHERLSDAIYMLSFGLMHLSILKRRHHLALVAFQSNVVAIILAKMLDIPIAVRLSNHFSSTDHEQSKLRYLSEIAKKYFYRKSDFVVANSEELARDYAKVLGCSVITIYNPVDIDWVIRQSREDVLESPFSNKRIPIVISVGRLVKQKNYKLLIRAFAKVLKTRKCNLVLVGEGNERMELSSLARELDIENYVYFMGFKDNPYKYIFRSDLFVLSSNYEGMPNVLVEAIACDVSVISTRCLTGPEEILDHGQGGILCACNDINELANAILLALENEKVSLQHKKHAKNSIAKYKIENISKNYGELVNDLFGNRSGHL